MLRTRPAILVRRTAKGRVRSRWWHGDAFAIVLAMLIVGGPALFTNDGFEYDFTNHLWLVWVQEHAISQHLAPTYFISAHVVGVFYPFFVFYGGTLYAATGALAALLGGRVVVAYVGTTMLAVGAAYGGLVWLSRQLGVRSWMAHAPAITFVASAYYVTNLYGRGAWPEFIATSMIPLLVASGWKLARSPRIEPVPAALLVVAVVFFAGSHNVTLLLGSLVLIAGLLALALSVGRDLAPRSRRRLLELSALIVLSVAVDAWFLLPDLVHASDTQISAGGIVPWSAYGFFNTPWMLFDPLRAVPRQSGAPALFVQAPDWLLFWVIAVGGALWSRVESRLRRAGCALTLLLMALLALIMIGPLWDAMPRALREVQFPYRLNTFVALCVAGLVIISVLSVQCTPTASNVSILRGALVGAMVISVGLCVWQLWVPSTHSLLSYTNRDGVFVSTHATPRTWYDQGVYADASQPVMAVPHGALVINPAQITSDDVTLTVPPPPGLKPFATNIAAGPYAAKLGGGLVRAGRTVGGVTVARRVRAGRGPVALSLAPAGGAVAVGRLISLLAIGALWLLLCYVGGARLLKRG